MMNIFDLFKKKLRTKVPKFKFINIENTNHCHGKCYFCPREKLNRPRGFMSVDRFEMVLSRLHKELGSFQGHVHLHGYGEPLLDKDLPEKVRIIRELWPDCYLFIVTTLAVPLETSYLHAIFQNGMNEIRVSAYAFRNPEYLLIYGCDSLYNLLNNLEKLKKVKIGFANCKVSVKLPPAEMYKQLGLDYNEDCFNKIKIELENYFSVADVMDELFNFGDGRYYKKSEQDCICTIVYGHRHQQLYIDWQLNVVPCCYDYNSSVIFGNIENDSLEEIFNGNKYKNFIKNHRSGRRDVSEICINCDRS